MSLIDLDVSAEPARPNPRRLTVGDPRRWLSTLTVAMCLIAVNASARPDALPSHPGWTVPIGVDATVFPSVGGVYVVDRTPPARITGYRMSDGVLQWSATLPVTGEAVLVRDSAVLVPIGPAPGVVDHTAALDRGTGAELWRQPGQVLSTTAGTALLTDPSGTIRRVRTADGTVLWTRSVPDAWRWTAGATGAWVAAELAHGGVQILRQADGGTVFHGTLPGSGAALRKDVLTLDDHQVYLTRTVEQLASVTAYTVVPMRRRWSRSTGIGHEEADRIIGQLCGPVFCFGNELDTVGLDRATGAVRWQGKGWSTITPAGPDRLVAQHVTGRRAMLNSATGEVVADLTDRTVIWDPDQTEPVFELRSSPGEPTVVDRIDLSTGALQPRGVVGVFLDECSAIGARLICRPEPGELEMTTIIT
jgi:outer membrane protein assembly factor BamB